MKMLSLALILLLAGCEIPKIEWADKDTEYLGTVASVSYTLGGKYGDAKHPIVQLKDGRTFLLSSWGSSHASKIRKGDKAYMAEDKQQRLYLCIELEENKAKKNLTVFGLD